MILLNKNPHSRRNHAETETRMEYFDNLSHDHFLHLLKYSTSAIATINNPLFNIQQVLYHPL